LRDYPYIVWSLEVTRQRPDWFLVPELKKTYADLRAAVKGGKSAVVD